MPTPLEALVQELQDDQPGALDIKPAEDANKKTDATDLGRLAERDPAATELSPETSDQDGDGPPSDAFMDGAIVQQAGESFRLRFEKEGTLPTGILR